MKQRLAELPIKELRLADNIRDDVGDITGLVDSIRLVGILEPIVVWPSEDGKHAEVGMGQRRLAAAKKAGLATVPCILRERPSERDRILMQLAENHERSDMSPIDEAHAFDDLLRLGISRRAIARSLKKSEDWVYRRIALLELPPVLAQAVHTGVISPTAANEFPRALIQDREVLRRLEKTRIIDDKALREFIRDEYRARQGTTRAIRRDGVRVVNVSIDHYETVKQAAKADRVTLTAWVEKAIDMRVRRNGHR